MSASDDPIAHPERWIKAGRPVKHSVTIAGHRTSFSLEEPFWVGLKEISEQSGVAINVLIRRLDEIRFVKGADIGLSGAVRIFVFKHYLDKLSRALGEPTAIHDLFEAPLLSVMKSDNNG